MAMLFQLVGTYAPYIYLVVGLVALYQLYRLWQVRGERRQAVFSLEREKASRDLSAIFTATAVLLVIMGLTYFAGSTLPRAAEEEVAPQATLPPEFSLNIVPTNTPLPVTPSATPLPVTPTATATPVPSTPDAVAAATLTAAAAAAPATPTAAPAPQPQAAAPAACPDPRALLTSPGNGATVSGVFSLLGTATHEQFSFYKVEFAPGSDAQGGFTYLADGRGPVFDGTLASVDTRGLGNGPWTFQLTVVDSTGNFPPPCRVTVNVQN